MISQLGVVPRSIPRWFTPVLVGVGNAVARTLDLELVQVVVPPAEGSLDDLVDVVERAATIDEYAAPDRWLGVEQGDLELEHVASSGGAWRWMKLHSAFFPSANF